MRTGRCKHFESRYIVASLGIFSSYPAVAQTEFDWRQPTHSSERHVQIKRVVGTWQRMKVEIVESFVILHYSWWSHASKYRRFFEGTTDPMHLFAVSLPSWPSSILIRTILLVKRKHKSTNRKHVLLLLIYGFKFRSAFIVPAKPALPLFPPVDFFAPHHELWPMILTYELIPNRVKMNHLGKCLQQRSFRSKFIADSGYKRSQSQTVDRLHCSGLKRPSACFCNCHYYSAQMALMATRMIDVRYACLQIDRA